MNVPKIRGGLIIDEKLIPDAFIALISFSSDILPNVIRVVKSTAIGTDNAIIHARFKNKYSKITRASIPFPKNLSIARIRKLIKRIKVIITRDNKKGKNISLIRYL